MAFIVNIGQLIEEIEKAKGYYDETGLDMHIAVVPIPNVNVESQTLVQTLIAVSTKHWSRVHYIKVRSTPGECWKSLEIISNEIGRRLIISEKGDYVYINKLSAAQTQSVFDKFKVVFGDDISRVWEISWDITGSVLPQK